MRERFRRPLQPWEPVERFEVGCERIQPPGKPRDSVCDSFACWTSQRRGPLCSRIEVTLDDLRSRPHLRLATKFPKATEAWQEREGLSTELVPLSSSVAPAPLLGLADAIVDLVQTGGTLRACRSSSGG